MARSTDVWTPADLAHYQATGQVPEYHSMLVTVEGVALAERQLLSQVRRLATAYGFEVYHTHDSRRSEEGWPDLVLCDGKRLIIAELKSATGKCTAAQETWLSLLRHTGCCEVYLWRPADLPAIERILREK